MSRADKDALAANLRQEVAAVGEKDRATFYGLDVAFHQILTTVWKWRDPPMCLRLCVSIWKEHAD